MTRTALIATFLLSVAIVRAQNNTNSAQDKTPASDTPYPNCVRIFDGKTFDGWIADPSTWSVVDGAMRGVGGTSRLAYTRADHCTFRLVVTQRVHHRDIDHRARQL